MIVCHCHGITDREIRASVQRGALSCGEVAQACGAGSGCGGCEPAVEDLVRSERRQLSMLQAEPISCARACRPSQASETAGLQSA
jgi:bacterioferritin-associated ferredoxin